MNTIETLDNILTQLDARQNQYVKIHGKIFEMLNDATEIVKRARLNATKKTH